MRGAGSALFVGIFLMIAGILNIVYGIAAIGNASFFTNDTQYVFSSLHTWGWITVILGIIQLTASFSLFAGRAYGQVVGIIAATLGAIGALLDVGGAHPVVVARHLCDLPGLRPRARGARRAQGGLIIVAEAGRSPASVAGGRMRPADAGEDRPAASRPRRLFAASHRR